MKIIQITEQGRQKLIASREIMGQIEMDMFEGMSEQEIAQFHQYLLHIKMNIKKLMNESRKHIVNYVNTTMLFTYWNIGKMIVEEQGGSRKAKYGNNLISELSKQLTFDFGKGFDERNLRKVRQFYLMYPIWDSVRPELTWTHYRTLIKIKEQNIRKFYMEEAIKGNWSVRQLERQIATCSYSRVIANNSEVEKIDNVILYNLNDNYSRR